VNKNPRARRTYPGFHGFTLHGFTLLELMFAVAIMAVLAVIAVSLFSSAVEKSRVGSAVADISIMQAEIERARSSNGNQLPDAYQPNRLDPWGRPYVYTKLEGVNGKGSARKDHALNPLNTDYDLFSMGKNGVYKSQVSQKDSVDDVIRARNGAYVGLAADF
jgi:general secretion pathway protein G